MHNQQTIEYVVHSKHNKYVSNPKMNEHMGYDPEHYPIIHFRVLFCFKRKTKKYKNVS